MTDNEMVTIPLETLRHLYDLAMDSPLICSGNFDSDDVVVLRETAVRIGVDPVTATPDEFIRDFPHPFRPRTYGLAKLLKPTAKDTRRLQIETEAEVLARLGDGYENYCMAGTYERWCGRPAADEKHTQVTP